MAPSDNEGNNGGDGFMIARQFQMSNLIPRVILLADPANLKADARVN